MAAATVFNAAVTNPGGTGTSITVALSTHAVGDILEIQVTNTGNTLWASNPTGWSRNDQRTVGTASTGIVHTWLWREVVSGDTLPLANPVCNLGATVTRSAVCRTLRGADRGGIFTSTEWQRGFSTGTANPVSPPTIVTPAPESLILHGYGQRTATNAPEPSGYTQDQEVIISGTIVLNASSKTVAAQNTSLSSQTASPTSGVRWAAGIMSIPSPDYPYYRSLSSTSATSVTQITGTLPTGTTASDVYGRADWIIAIVKATGSGISITAQDGSAWTDLMFETTSNNSDTIKVFACKYAVGRNLQFNRSTSGNIALRLITYRNCQQTDAIGNFHIKQNAGTPASWNAQDRAEAKSTVVAFIVADADTNNVHTPPAGWVERGDSLGIGCADQTFDAAGSTATANWTTTNAANVAGLVEIISHTVTAANVIVTPANATLTTSTFVAQVNQALIPSAQSLTTSTFAPTVTVGLTVSPSNASLTTSTFAPKVNLAVIPSTASLTTATFAPKANLAVVPGTASLLTTGFMPKLAETTTPSTASLATTTFAAKVNLAVIPAAASLTTSAFAPKLAETTTPSTAPLTLGTFAPTVNIGNAVSVTPDTAALTTSAFEPTIAASDNQSVIPATATLSTATFALSLAEALTPGTSSLTTFTFAPSVNISNNISVAPDTAALSTNTFAPSLGLAISPSTLGLTTTGFEPTVSAGNAVSVIPGTASLSLSTFAPTVAAHVTVTPEAASLTTSTFAPVLSETVSPSVVSLTTTSFAPTISTTAGVTVTPDIAVLTTTGFNPTVSAGGNLSVEPGVASLVTTGYAPNVVTISVPPSSERTFSVEESSRAFTPEGVRITNISSDARIFEA